MTAVWIRSPRVLWRRIADGVLLLPPDAAEPMIVTGSAAAMWEMLASPLHGDEVARRLAEIFHTTTDQAQADTAPFLAELASAGIVTRMP